MENMSLLSDFALAFVPMFFAMDALGIVPIYISLTSGMKAQARSKLLRNSLIVGLIVAIAFLVAGKFIFNLLHITADDFRVGGGIVLLLIGISDLLFSDKEKRRSPTHELAVVPIGLPLIIGPAALTTILVLVDKYGYFMCLASLVTNLILVWIIFANSNWIVRVMGEGGTVAFGKVASLFIVAIAISMIRIGVTNFLVNGANL